MYKLFIGSHISLKAPNYLVDSLNEALSYNANAMMIYTGAPQNTIRMPLSKFKISEFKVLAKEKKFDLNNLVIHAPYIFNPANSLQKDYAIEILIKEIKRTAEIGSKILILHPGAHLGQGIQQGVINSSIVIKEALNRTKELDVIVAIETMSGKGTEICYKFDQVKSLLDMINSPRVKVCMDTCHIHDAGYDINGDLNSVLNDFNNIIGFNNVVAIHINDSKNICGSRKDRHANLNSGHIKIESILKIIYLPEFNNVPKILETPYIDNKPPYKEEIDFIIKNRDSFI